MGCMRSLHVDNGQNINKTSLGFKLLLSRGNRREWEHMIHNMSSTKKFVFVLLTMNALYFFSACFCLSLECCTSDLELLKMPNTIKIQEPVSVMQLWSSTVPSDTHGTRKINHTYCMKFHIGELHHKFYWPLFSSS